MDNLLFYQSPYIEQRAHIESRLQYLVGNSERNRVSILGIMKNGSKPLDCRFLLFVSTGKHRLSPFFPLNNRA